MQRLRSLIRFLSGSQVFNVVFVLVIAAISAWAIEIDVSANNFGRGISLVCFLMALGTSLGYATVLGSFGKYRRADVVSVALALISGGLTFLILGSHLGIWGKPAGPTNDIFAKIHGWLQPSTFFYFAVVVGGFGGLVFLYQFLRGFVARKFDRQKRIAILVSILHTLALGAMLQNGVAFFFPEILENAVVVFVAFGGGIALVDCLETFCRTPRLDRRVLIGAVMLGGLCLGGVVAQLTVKNNILISPLMFLVGVPFLLLPLIWISPACGGSEECRELSLKNSLVLFVGQVSLLAAIFLLPILASGGLMTNRQKSEWQLRRNAVTIEFEDSKRTFQNAGGLIIQSIEFAKNSAPDSLSALPENYRSSDQVSLLNLHGKIDLKGLKNNPAGARLSSVRVEGGVLTDIQLNDLVQIFPYVTLSRVDFVNESGQVKVVTGVAQSLILESLGPGESDQILEVYENPSWLHVQHCDFNPEDWTAMVKHAQKNGSYILNVSLPEEFLDSWRPKPGDTLSRIQVNSTPMMDGILSDPPNPMGLNVDNARRLILEHGMEWCFPVDPTKQENEAFGKLFWICPQQAWRRLVSGNTFSIKQERIVSVDGNGDPICVYSPWWYTNINWVVEYPKLQKLIVDPTLVYPEASSTRIWSIDLNPVTNARQLEHLQLFFNYVPVNLDFLGELPNLKTLVISSDRQMNKKTRQSSGVLDVSERVGGKGFEQCIALEKLILLTSPSPQVIKEVGQIKTLKELVIVDGGYVYQEKELQERIRKWMKNVDITFVNPSDFELEYSPELIEHRGKMQEKSLQYFFGEHDE